MKRIFFYILILLLSITFYTKSVFAAPPTGGYEPGETLNPDCAPGDADCIVTPLIAQDEGVDLSGNVLKLNFTGDGVSSSIASGVVTVNVPGGSSQWTTTGSDIYYDSGNVSIGIDNSSGSTLSVLGDLRLEAGSNEASISGFMGDTGANFLQIRNNSSDVDNKFTIQGNGQLGWGSGLSSQDTYLFRNSANTLRVQDNLIVNGTLSVGTASPNASSILDLASTTKGFLTPRMTTAQVNAIISPATGLLVYNTDTSRFNYYNGTSWSPVSDSILKGSTDSDPSAMEETWLGEGAGFDVIESGTTMIGYSAGYNAVNATSAVFVGAGTGAQSTNAFESIFIGASAGTQAPNAANSIFIGSAAGLNDTVDNTVSGTSILIGNNTSTGGFSNSIAIGTGAVNTSANQLLIDDSYTKLSLRGVNYVLPSSGGGSGSVLTNDGSNNLSWSALPDSSNINPNLILESTFQLPGSYLNVLSYKEAIFLKSQTSITSVDVSNPFIPEIMDTATLTSSGGNSQAWDIDANFAAVSAGNNVDIFDVSNISNILKTDTVSINLPLDIKIHGQYVYVLNGDSPDTLSVIDVSDKQNISVVNTLSLSFNAPRIISIENNIMTIGDVGQIQTIDISNPVNPTHLQTSNSLGSSYFFNNAVVDGDYAYVAYNDGTTLELRVVDISNILAISNLYSVDTGNIFLTQLKKYENYLISSGYGSGVATVNMVNVEDPDNAYLVSTVESDTDELVGAAIVGNRVFSADTVEVTNNLYTFVMGGIKAPSIVSSVVKSGNVATQEITSSFAKISNALSVGFGGIVSSGLTSISPNFSTDQIVLKAGSSFVTDGSAVLRLQDANSTCDFDADTGSPTCGSDETLKKNISSIEGSLSKVLGLRPANYNWLTEEDDAPLQHGFIAQEVEAIFPHLVTESTWIDGTTRKFLNTGGMIPYIVGSIKDMYTEFTTNFETQRVQTQELCVGNTCISEEQFLEVFGQNITPSQDQNNNSQNNTPEPEEVETQDASGGEEIQNSEEDIDNADSMQETIVLEETEQEIQTEESNEIQEESLSNESTEEDSVLED